MLLMQDFEQRLRHHHIANPRGANNQNFAPAWCIH
jgi:hypothetical protein